MRQSGRERAYAALKSFVLGDPSAAGAFLNEQELADRIGVSRTPVREALLMLAGEDLVQLVPGRGALVLSPTVTQIREILQAREVLEVWALRTVLMSGQAWADSLAAMKECVDRQANLLEEGASATTFIEVDREFHTNLIRAAGNSVIADMYETLRARHVLIGAEAIGRTTDRARNVIAEHRAIVDALEGGDHDGARQAMVTHLAATRAAFTGG